MQKLKFIITTVLLFCIFGTAKPNSLYNSKEIKDSIEIKIDTMIAQMGLSSVTPGGVVGIIKDGKIIFKKAYGLANFETKEPNKTSIYLIWVQYQNSLQQQQFYYWQKKRNFRLKTI
jgi:CubicO group peptidase (beta-lactamase class C family)